MPALFQYLLPYSQFSCSCCGHYIITLVRINTHFIYFYSYLYRVAINNHKGDSYSIISGKSYLLLLCSLLFLLIITNHYSTYTLFTVFVSKTVLYITNSSPKQQTVLLDERKGFFVFLFFRHTSNTRRSSDLDRSVSCTKARNEHSNNKYDLPEILE